MTFRTLIRRFVTVHKCGGCGEILDFASADDALCKNCKIKWNLALIEECPRCLCPVCECMCMPKRMSAEGVLCHRKLFFYKKDAASAPTMRLLFLQKRKRLSRMVEFSAEQMADAVREELSVIGEDNAIITFVPRSKRARLQTGFDQSELLAHRLSCVLGIPCKRVFDTRFFAKTQKNLSANQRTENARKNIYMTGDCDVAGKYVLLIDDIVTTGAGMSACARLLKRAGCLGVLCFSLATENKV